MEIDKERGKKRDISWHVCIFVNSVLISCFHPIEEANLVRT